MNEQATSGEGSAAVEHLEQQILGNKNYQKVEVVHRFADSHPWFHPLLVIGIVAVIVGIAWLIKRNKPSV